jgi:hypothetical protein
VVALEGEDLVEEVSAGVVFVAEEVSAVETKGAVDSVVNLEVEA